MIVPSYKLFTSIKHNKKQEKQLSTTYIRTDTYIG
jgi:uncharacterized protein YktA (UPF0223 family)